MESVRELCGRVTDHLTRLFARKDNQFGVREDSRAFGSMVQKEVGDEWPALCTALGVRTGSGAGSRSIYDYAFETGTCVTGFDVKTKDLDARKYSDGGVCSVANLLSFMVNRKATLAIIEIGHAGSPHGGDLRSLDYIKVAPVHLLPVDCYRIENLGTGQLRLNYSLHQVYAEIAWDRGLDEFLEMFTDLAIRHYRRVGRDAEARARALERFRQQGFRQFSLPGHA
jgi:hypothetical protein